MRSQSESGRRRLRGFNGGLSRSIGPRSFVLERQRVDEKSTHFSGQFRMVIGSDFLAAPDGSPHLARFDQESRIAPLGEPVGFFEDGWVRAQASFRFQALE